jgi:hypothetical protein
MCREGEVRAGADCHDHVVVDPMAQLQRSLSPPAVGRNGKLRRFVQPPSVRKRVSWHRCLPRMKFVFATTAHIVIEESKMRLWWRRGRMCQERPFPRLYGILFCETSF